MSLEELITGILDDIYDIKEDLRLHAGLELYGIKHIIKRGFNGTFKKLDALEIKRKELSKQCLIEKINYGYVERNLYLKKFISVQPIESDIILMTALKVGAYIETFIYIKEFEKDLYYIKKSKGEKNED